MKIKNLKRLGLVSIVLMVVSQGCMINDKTGEIVTGVTPQALPETVSGFNFPEDSLTIYQWLSNRDTESITKHAWGIWAGLTANSDQVYNLSDTLLIYETWLGVSDIATQCANGDTLGGCVNAKFTREKLDFPNQLTHNFGSSVTSAIQDNPGFYVSVSYDPNAACFATKNLILNQSSITKKLVKDSIGKIPPFPNNSVTIKPTYFIGQVSDDFIRIPAWHGEPESLEQVYGPSAWNAYIFVDVNNLQTPGKVAVPVDSTVTSPPASAIVNLNEFIHYSLDTDAATYMNKQQLGQTGDKIKSGDLAILICMHVGTKEISNWTWQTFFWAIDPSTPDFPSSAWEAGLRPEGLNGAAAHYAVSTAYAMVWPNQPITNGTNEGVEPIIGYNPYLEAGLSAPFGDVNKLDSSYQYGMQTNCMSCHAMATANATNGKSLKYTADQYVDMSDSIFYDWVQLDFAWSIQSNINETK